MQRSKREGSEIGFAARKHSETDLRMQRSGREDTMVGVAARKQAEMDLWWQRSGRERAVVGFAERGEGGVREEGTRRERGGRARKEGEEGGRGGRDEEGGTPMQNKGPEPGLGLRTFVVFCCSAAVVCLVCRCSMSSVLLCGERDAPATYFVSLSRRFLREASSTISPSTSSPSAMMKAAGMAGMLYRPMYGDAFPRASHTFVQGSS